MKVGIYGGSFNPIHRGHTGLATDICRAGLVDEVWLMVSPLNPLKRDQQTDLLPTDLRLEMARLATADSPCLQVSDLETRLSLPSYTVHTLAALHEQYPQHEFALIVGEDNWQRFDRWYHADEIRARHDLIVYGRDAKSGIVVHHPDGSVEVHPQPRRYDISSTQIREALGRGQLGLARRWLHRAVFRYVLQHRLFFTKNSLRNNTLS